MKTIVFKSVKLFMFLLLAVLSSFVGIAQTIQPNVIINPIGGRQDVPTMPYGYKIGGKGTDSSTGQKSIIDMHTSIFDIGGKQSPQPTLISSNQTPLIEKITDIGVGRSTSGDTGQKSLNAGLVQCSFLKSDIGGKSTTGELNSNSTLTIGGNKPPVGEFTKSNDIGGRSQEPPLLLAVPNDCSIPILGVYS